MATKREKRRSKTRDTGSVALKERPQPVVVPITTFAPEPFDLLCHIPVAIQAVGDEYVATFFDANVNASGSTETDALNNLKDVMLALFGYLSSQPLAKLGPGPARQLAVLREFIRERA